MSQRVCFQLRIKPERLDEYVQRHAAVWPELLEVMHECGWRNYSLFLRDDGEITGYFEAEDLAAAQAAMAGSEVDARWQAEMQEFFEIPENGSPSVRLREVFNLGDQLAAARS